MKTQNYSIIGYNKNGTELGYWTDASDEFTADPVNFGVEKDAKNEITRALKINDGENERLGIRFKLAAYQ